MIITIHLLSNQNNWSHKCLFFLDPMSSTIGTSSESRQKKAGRKKKKSNQAKCYRENEKLKAHSTTLQRKVWQLQKQQERKRKLVRTPDLSPKSKMRRILHGSTVVSNVRKELFKGIVLEEELKKAKEVVSDSDKKKAVLYRILSGRVAKKYKLLKQCKNIFPAHISRRGRKWNHKTGNALTVSYQCNASYLKKKEAVVNYYLTEDASIHTPGKRDYVIVNREKVQKRYLTAPMSTLYRKFLSQTPLVVSFSTFCKHRPPHVVEPKFSDRDTCLCEKCDNFKLLFNSLKTAQVLNVKNREDLFNGMCCDTTNKEKCLFRTCKECKSKDIEYNITNGNGRITYEKWVTKKIPHRSKPNKTMIISKKEEVETTVTQCVSTFKEMLKMHMKHVGRVLHQRAEWKYLLEHLTDQDVCFVIDWSEKYAGKYFEEIQKMHFGGSHKELSLHTGRVYRKEFSASFSTVSNAVKQGPRDIWAHMKPLLLKYVTKQTKTLHVMSDGPTTQYRSRTMFNTVCTYISELLPQLDRIVWNFSECGHGKSVADGTGGTIKRVADSVIKHGSDIIDVQSFVSKVSERCPNVFLLQITDEDIEEAKCMPLPDILPFKGTLQVHQYHWLRSSPRELKFKTMSCYHCPLTNYVLCEHYSMGKPWVLVRREGGSNSKESAKKIGKSKSTTPPPEKQKTTKAPTTTKAARKVTNRAAQKAASKSAGPPQPRRSSRLK